MTTRTYRSVDLWAPALHPNTLLHVAVPEPGPSRDPIVRHFAIKHGDHEAVGVVKKMTRVEEGVSRFSFEVICLLKLTCSSCSPTMRSM